MKLSSKDAKRKDALAERLSAAEADAYLHWRYHRYMRGCSHGR